MDLLIEGAHAAGAEIAVGLVDHRAAPQHVVDQQQTALAQELQRPLVVAVVVWLVGVDEAEIELPRLTFLEESIQGFDRGPDAQIDLFVDAGLAPVAATDRCPFLADIAGDQLAVGGKRLGATRSACVAKEFKKNFEARWSVSE